MTMNPESSNRRRFAGTLAAGSVLAAVSAGIVAAWAVTDCVRFQSKPGECDATVETHAPTFVAAIAAVLASLGSWTMGYETLNPSLTRRRKPTRRRGPDGKFLPSDEP